MSDSDVNVIRFILSGILISLAGPNVALADGHSTDSEVPVETSQILCSDIVILAEERPAAIAYIMGYVAGKIEADAVTSATLENVNEVFIANCVANPNAKAVTVMKAAFLEDE
ncbi:MAG: hypothetical protein Alpg2KO_00270 [Alphaproteobacteria bacterium]